MITAGVTGMLMLVTVLVSNSIRQAVVEVKLYVLAMKVEKRNLMIKRTNALERDVEV